MTLENAIRTATKAAKGIVCKPMKLQVSQASDGVLQMRVSTEPKPRSSTMPEVISESLWVQLDAAPSDFERFCRSRWHLLVEKHRLTLGR